MHTEAETYFPILIEFQDNNEERVCVTPKEIPHHRPYKVLHTAFYGAIRNLARKAA